MKTGPEPDQTGSQPRDVRGRFLSGKPSPRSGRPKGSKTRPKPEVLAEQKAREQLSALLGQAVEVLRDSLKSDDPAVAQGAAKVVMAKVLPDKKTPGNFVQIPELTDPDLTLEQKAQVLSGYLGRGQITAEQFQSLTRSLESAARIADVEAVQQVLTLIKSGTPVGDAIKHVEQRGARVTH